MNNNFVGLFLIITKFFCNIVFELQEYYITSLFGQNIFLQRQICFTYVFSHLQMGTHVDNLSAKAIIIDLLV